MSSPLRRDGRAQQRIRACEGAQASESGLCVSGGRGHGLPTTWAVRGKGRRRRVASLTRHQCGHGMFTGQYVHIQGCSCGRHPRGRACAQINSYFLGNAAIATKHPNGAAHAGRLCQTFVHTPHGDRLQLARVKQESRLTIQCLHPVDHLPAARTHGAGTAAAFAGSSVQGGGGSASGHRRPRLHCRARCAAADCR